MTAATTGTLKKKKSKAGAYRAAREALDNMHQSGQYDITEVNSVAGELQELAQRIKRVHSLSKEYRAVTLSPYIASMLKIVGKQRMVEDFDL